MTNVDYKFIDVHVHIMPWHMLKPAAAAAMEATQPNMNRLKPLTTDNDALIANMDANNIEWIGLISLPQP